MNDPLVSSGLLREFTSRDAPFDQEHLAKSRAVLERGQRMDWVNDGQSYGAHKLPCFPIHDVEWLFGYIDHLTAEIEHRRNEEKVAALALVNACHDGWSDGPGALAGYLRDARAAVESGAI